MKLESACPFSDEQTIEADINWKLAIDTFGENYHFDVLHKETAPEIFRNLQTSGVRQGRMTFMNKPGYKYVQDNGLDRDSWPFRWITLTVYFLYPNTILLLDPAGVDLTDIRTRPTVEIDHGTVTAEPTMVEMRKQAERGDNLDENATRGSTGSSSRRTTTWPHRRRSVRHQARRPIHLRPRAGAAALSQRPPPGPRAAGARTDFVSTTQDLEGTTWRLDANPDDSVSGDPRVDTAKLADTPGDQ